MQAKLKLFLSFTLATLAFAANAEQPSDPAGPGIVVRGVSTNTPSSPPKGWLIPSRLLQRPYEEWSSAEQSLVSPQVIEEFNEYLDSVRAMKRSGVCTPGEGIPASQPQTSSRKKVTLYDVAGSQKNIVLGEIVGLGPAWDTSTYQVATLVQLKVVAVIRSIDPISVGDIMTYRRPWGSVDVRGVTLCSYLEPVAAQTQHSALAPTPVERRLQTVLLLGRYVPGNNAFMGSGRFEEFQVIEGKIFYPQGVSYYPEQPELLSAALLKVDGSHPVRALAPVDLRRHLRPDRRAPG